MENFLDKLEGPDYSEPDPDYSDDDDDDDDDDESEDPESDEDAEWDQWEKKKKKKKECRKRRLTITNWVSENSTESKQFIFLCCAYATSHVLL